jgi:Cu-Zn family superoxide dismutase
MKAHCTILVLSVFLMVAADAAWAGETVVDMHVLTPEGTAVKIGTISIGETAYGTIFTPDLSLLTPGLHGFHIHAHASCDAGEKDGQMVPGMAAGGHYDPGKTNSHKGPYADGHLGDLPALYADSSGAAVHPVLAPRVHLADLKGRALMIHQGGDNYSDVPNALGGGGARVACGVVE